MKAQNLNVGSLTGDEGYLLDPSDWNESIAETFATEENIVLSEEHWHLIRFVREWYAKHGVAPSSRDAVIFMKNSGAPRNRLFELFPYGYVQQVCKISGMKKPRSWSTG
jgi:tRNA 2-thiouridine synthesizing protein E